MALLTLFRSFVKCLTTLILQTLSISTGLDVWSKHCLTPDQLLGPLKRITDKRASVPSPSKAATNASAAFFEAIQPFLPSEPLPSMRRTTSNLALQVRVLAFGASLHLWRLQSAYARRPPFPVSHMPGQVPDPVACFLTNFCRFRVPESQSLEQRPQAPQSLSSQSDSQDCTLHAFVSDVSPHGLPLFFMWRWTSRNRCMTPPPHSALHLLQPAHASSLQSTGHGMSWQLFICARGKHFAPPWGCVATDRVSFCTPPPHGLEHSCASQADTW